MRLPDYPVDISTGAYGACARADWGDGADGKGDAGGAGGACA